MLDTQSQTAPQSTAERGVVCLSYRAINKGALRGFCDLSIPRWHLILRDCKLMEGRSGGDWIALPSTSFTTKTGEKRYTSLIEFDDEDAKDRFQRAAVAAVKQFTG